MNKDFILTVLKQAEENSTCLKRKVGAALFDIEENRLVSYGSNRVLLPTTHENCNKCVSGEIILALCPALHAEPDCLMQQELEGGKDYALAVSYSPCPICCKVIRSIPQITTVIVKEPRLKEISAADTKIYGVKTYDALAQKLLEGISYIRLWTIEPVDAEIL